MSPEAPHGRPAPVTGRRLPRFSARTFSSLRHRDFRFLWMGTVFMSGGQWIQQVTLGWLLYELTGSAVLLGALNGLRALPFLVTGPTAGVAADRMDRRKLLLVTQLLLAVTAFAMGAVVVLGLVEVWHLFVFTLITGSLWSFNQPVRQALVPGTVPKRDLMNALALNSMGFNITKVIGPTVGGFLIVWFGVHGNFFVQAVAYVGVFLAIFAMRVPPTPPEAREVSVIENLREGLSYVRTTPIILTLMATAIIPVVFAMPYLALMPVFQKDVLGVGPAGLGLLLAAPGVGAVLSLTVLASVAHLVRRKGLLVLGALTLMGVFLILFSQARSMPVAMAMLVGVGAFQLTFLTTNMTLVQTVIPDGLRGRVMSIYMLDRGLAPLGALAAGAAVEWVGAPATVAGMGAVVVLLVLLVGWRVPSIRRLEG